MKNWPAEKARIQIVSRLFAPESAAAALRLEALSCALAEAGAKVRVMTTFAAPGTDPSLSSPVEHPSPSRRRVKVERHQALRDKSGYIKGYLPYLSFDIPAFFRLLMTEAPDVYVAEPPPTTGVMVRVLATLRRRPYVYYAADIWSDAAGGAGVNPLVVRALRMMERFAWGKAHRVITVCDPMAKRVLELAGSSLSADRLVIVPNGVDTTLFTPEGEDPKPLQDFYWQGGPLFVYAGTASFWQGAEVFIKAFAQIYERFPGAQLLFLGQGTQWESIGKMAQALPKGAVGMGKCDTKQAAAWQRVARACLVSLKPGQDYAYAYPTKALTSLASGTPVIYAGVGPGATDIKQHNLGWAVNWAVDDVAKAMEKALQEEPSVSYRQSLRQWAVENRCVRVTAHRAGQTVLEACKYQ